MSVNIFYTMNIKKFIKKKTLAVINLKENFLIKMNIKFD